MTQYFILIKLTRRSIDQSHSTSGLSRRREYEQQLRCAWDQVVPSFSFVYGSHLPCLVFCSRPTHRKEISMVMITAWTLWTKSGSLLPNDFSGEPLDKSSPLNSFATFASLTASFFFSSRFSLYFSARSIILHIYSFLRSSRLKPCQLVSFCYQSFLGIGLLLDGL